MTSLNEWILKKKRKKENRFRKQILSIIHFSTYAHPSEWSNTAELADAPFVAPVNLITGDDIIFKAEKSIQCVKNTNKGNLSNQKSCLEIQEQQLLLLLLWRKAQP